ncbi:GNAT family N-acetyltransferase [Bradyrhizobium sp. JYMT SZCCT0428]|uniref:GNAT family N-acetyltransferase n=1 Tax=Bradyrhizobium sp. JYMT SZCCT0428 TaxID=2807673 RepID=UPI001BA9B383|nr:GNAT family N-acetyltransferase [Bradyrhizobium sp. JYMT SZCCT0428]MBR1153386.1 GNAT family N-acetyltransferase [Bradyrhizobium sp. JYMT SZCCT0428]
MSVTDIVIRTSIAADLESLMALMIELQEFEQQFTERAVADREFAVWYIERLLRVIDENDGLLLVATLNGASCGFAAGFPDQEPELRDRYFLIAELVVTRGQRGRGIGRRLMLAMEDAARARGLKRMGIGVLAGSDRVHRLYTALGYRDYAISLRKELPS